jgi:2-oxoacid:acceptor oxidoreductase gamma subunit (pyruvate/2-ketoisovalerate family)/2-oxoacid:acceptor oxidoreductase delta subunit (pyruvate/2-ketoisovalerate family)
MVTAFEILAKVFSKLSDYQVQAFPAFGVERTGAPIQAFLRVAKKEILNRSNIYRPHLIVVFDESLLDQVPVFDGLKTGGAVLLNTEKKPSAFSHTGKTIFTVPATKISLDLGLGSKSLPIVNAAMIGAIIRIFDADLQIAQGIIRANVPAKPEANARSAAVAFDSVQGLEAGNNFLIRALETSQLEGESENGAKKSLEKLQEPEGLAAPFWEVPMSKNKTGNWRLITPSYIDRTPPCSANCPAGTDVRAFVRLASERKFDEAWEIIYRHNPFPGICGRVCPHFCEQNCNRNEFDSGVNIGAVERFLGDRNVEKPVEAFPLRHKERIAVIGSGPAGLTAALRLREKGYLVTVFEALPQAGGMMRTGIPKFRLPDEVLDREITRIEKQGVHIVLNKKITVEELAGTYSAIVTAVGSHIGADLRIGNEGMITEGISFLRKFKLEGEKDGVQKGRQIAVIGGGNTAIDVARTMLRLGAAPTIYYRRTIKEMPAIAQEVEEALAEGVRIEFLTAPATVSRDAGGRIELTLRRMELGDPDASGRRSPVPVAGSETIIRVDKVVAAIGQQFDDYVFNGSSLQPRQGRMDHPSDVQVFCAGDMAWGGTVAEAIGSGNKVAEEVHAFLREIPYSHEGSLPEVVLPEDINFAYYLPSARHQGEIHHARDFYGDFAEVTKGLNEEEITAETARCLHCGDCFSCGNCFNFCPDAAIYVDENGRLRIDYDYCKGCGICVQECPCSAMQFKLIEEAIP